MSELISPPIPEHEGANNHTLARLITYAGLSGTLVSVACTIHHAREAMGHQMSTSMSVGIAASIHLPISSQAVNSAREIILNHSENAVLAILAGTMSAVVTTLAIISRDDSLLG